MTEQNENLKPSEVADMLGISLRTQNRWHALRMGPARCKVGRTVLYRYEAIEAWLAANETKPTKIFVGDAV